MRVDGTLPSSLKETVRNDLLIYNRNSANTVISINLKAPMIKCPPWPSCDNREIFADVSSEFYTKKAGHRLQRSLSHTTANNKIRTIGVYEKRDC